MSGRAPDPTKAAPSRSSGRRYLVGVSVGDDCSSLALASLSTGDCGRAPKTQPQGRGPSRQAVLAELCHRLVREAYIPAAVLIDRKHECRYSLGPIDRYLRVAPGFPSHDLLAMVHPSLRLKLKSAIERSSQENARAVIARARINHSGGAVVVRMAIQPILNQGERLLLVCFIDEETRHERKRGRPVWRGTDLEQKHETTRTQLRHVVRNLEISSHDRNTINEESTVITERRHASVVRRVADRRMEPADVVKSRLLTTAGHELRQPLQTLALLRWLLAQAVE